jgi:hypothetical protein
MTPATAETLIAGYRSYAGTQDLSTVTETAPAATPAILSFIGMSSLPCGSAISVIGGSAASTIAAGC